MLNTLHYFIYSELPQEVSFYNSNFARLKHSIRLNGYSGFVVETVVNAVKEEADKRNLPVEIIHDPIDGSQKGIIVPEMSAGFISETLHADLAGNKQKAAELFLEAKKIHDKQEEIYIKNTDFERLNKLTDETADMLFGDFCRANTGRDIHRFFGASTVFGSMNFIPELTADIQKRYFIKGRPGTGKSTFLKKLAAAAMNSGHDVEVYHCSFDPKSLDMIIVRQLGICVFDSTAPHEYFPEREGDIIIDIYETCVLPGTDEKYEEELGILENEYRAKLSEGKYFYKEFYKDIEIDESSITERYDSERDMLIEKRIKDEILRCIF